MKQSLKTQRLWQMTKNPSWNTYPALVPHTSYKGKAPTLRNTVSYCKTNIGVFLFDTNEGAKSPVRLL